MEKKDNNTVIDFGHGEDDQPDKGSSTVIEISSSSDVTHFKAGSSNEMRTILDNDDDFGLNFSSVRGNVGTVGFLNDNLIDAYPKESFPESNGVSDDYQAPMSYDAYDQSYEDSPGAFMEYVDGSSQLVPGTLVAGRYEIGRVLGVGGFSIVYRAFDKKLETEVALKELFPPSLAFRKPGEERIIINGRKSDFEYLLDRFVLEARTMAKYNSDPNIVNIFDCVLENNTAYIVMEYLDGQNLEEYTMSKPDRRLELDEAISIIGCVLDGLERVHKKGIVHRDIKPKNIVLTTKGEIKIIDFGAARFYATEEEVVNNFTKVLTPGFAPPEQYRKDKKQGSFTDVYAAAATFYYMLTGEVPEISVDRDIADHLVPLAEKVPGIPDYVDNAVRRAMVLNCDLRVQRASDFKLALLGKKILRTAQEEKKRRIKNRLLLLVATMFLFAVGLAGLIVYEKYYAGGVSICSDIQADDTIEIWLPVSASDAVASEQMANYEEAFSRFANYVYDECEHKIEVNPTFISENEYAASIAEAALTGKLPDVYDSSIAEVTDSRQAECDKIFRYLSEENYVFYSYYQNGEINKGKFSVGFDSYVLYYNDKLREELEIEKIDSFESALSFSYKDTKKYGICCRQNHYGFSSDDNVYIGNDASELFMNGEALCYIGRVSESKPLLQSLPGFCKILRMPGNEKIPIRLRTWSMHAISDNRIAVASALLYYVTGEAVQDWMYLQHSDILPVNSLVLSNYSKFYSEFSFITDDSSQYVIE